MLFDLHLGLKRLNNTDLIMYQCGMEDCDPGHGFGPAVRDHYLIHYIRSGKGIFQVGDRTYQLKKGQGFLICPGAVTYYKADDTEPWHYSWVGFTGIKAEEYLKQAGLHRQQPVFTAIDEVFIQECFDRMVHTGNLVYGREIRVLGYLHLFLSQLIEENKTQEKGRGLKANREDYIRKSVEYIEKNFSRKITVKGMAKSIGLDRSYFCSLFKEYLNIPPQEYIVRLRMDKACCLMKSEGLSIGDIARSVGYEDPLMFSRMFKKTNKMSPKKYRDTLIM